MGKDDTRNDEQQHAYDPADGQPEQQATSASGGVGRDKVRDERATNIKRREAVYLASPGLCLSALLMDPLSKN